MHHLLGLPTEVILWVFESFDSLRDALHLSQCCKDLNKLFNHQRYQAKILESIVIGDKLPLPKSPDANWLEVHFGAGSLWRPTESELPVRLTDPDTRKFLTIVGFPLVQCTGIDWESNGLKTSVDAGVELYEYDADEIFGRRWADDDSPPVNFCYNFGCIGGNAMAMVNAEDGSITHYDLGGYDERADRGWIASSMPSLLVLLGTMEMVINRIGEVQQELSDEAFENLRTTTFCQVREIMADYDDCVDDGSYFWDALFE